MFTFYGCYFMMGLGKPNQCTKFEVVSFSHCVNIEGGPPNVGELSKPRAMPSFSSACDFMMGLGKFQLRAKFEVLGFTYYGNIRESVFKRQIGFLSQPPGELGVTYGLHL